MAKEDETLLDGVCTSVEKLVAAYSIMEHQLALLKAENQQLIKENNWLWEKNTQAKQAIEQVICKLQEENV